MGSWPFTTFSFLVVLKSNLSGDFLLMAEEGLGTGAGAVLTPPPVWVLCLLMAGDWVKDASSANWFSNPDPGLEPGVGDGFGLLDPWLAPLDEPPPR